MKLSEYASANNTTYHKAWRQFKRGELKGSVNEDRNIDVSPLITGKTSSEGVLSLSTSESEQVIPKMIAFGSTDTRRNRAATIERTDKYSNIESGLLPFGPTGIT